MPLGPHQIHFGTGSDLIYAVDPSNGDTYFVNIDDVGRASRLRDAFEEIDFVMSLALLEYVRRLNT